MRVLPALLYILLFSVPIFAQTTTPAPGDPRAIVVVQAAIKALGGATAIAEAKSWTFQAQMQGPRANGGVTYSVSTDTDTGRHALRNGTTRPAPSIHSHFVPALVGAILAKESQDAEFSIQYRGVSTLDSQPVTVIVFAVGALAAQIWYFQNSTGFPVEVDFRLPAEIGARSSFPGLVALSDYRSVSGVLYPFRIVSSVAGKPREIVTLQSVAPGAAASPNEFNGPGGDLR
jgi:hypothetical protein